MSNERIFAEIVANICTRKFWQTYADDQIPAGVVLAQPWHVEGQDIIVSQAAYDQAQVATAAAAAARATITADPLRVALVNQLKGATNAQISNYVDANVTDLASARLMLKRIILVLAATNQ